MVLHGIVVGIFVVEVVVVVVAVVVVVVVVVVVPQQPLAWGLYIL